MKWKLFNEHDTISILDSKNKEVVKWQGFDGVENALETAKITVQSRNTLIKTGEMIKNDLNTFKECVFMAGKDKQFASTIKRWDKQLTIIAKAIRGELCEE